MLNNRQKMKGKPVAASSQRSTFQVSVQRGKARSRVRYVETNQAGPGCKCL